MVAKVGRDTKEEIKAKINNINGKETSTKELSLVKEP